MISSYVFLNFLHLNVLQFKLRELHRFFSPLITKLRNWFLLNNMNAKSYKEYNLIMQIVKFFNFSYDFHFNFLKF